MMKYAAAALLASLVSVVTSCGEDDAQSAAQPRVAAAGHASGMLLVQKRPSAAWAEPETEVFCSGTLIAPDVVVTSARCANVAKTAQVAFSTDPQGYVSPTLVRSVVLAPDALGAPCAAPQDPYADAQVDPDSATHFADDAPSAADASPEDPGYAPGDNHPPQARQAACEALRARCGVHDVTAPDAATLTCLYAQPLEMLRQAAFLGFGPGHDLGLLFLEHAMPDTPATLAGACVQRAFLRPKAQVRSVDFMRHIGPDASDTLAGKTAALELVVRHAALHTLTQTQASELWVATDAGRDATDRGGALQVHYAGGGGASPWHVTAVASRPWLFGAGSDTGMIYSRIDAPALDWIAATLQAACKDGRRSDCHGGAEITTTRLAPPENCSQGAPTWVVPLMLLGWALHRSGQARRGARARLMYGLAFVALVGSSACGESPPHADIGQGEGRVQQAIVQGSPAHDRYLAVGAIVVPGTHGADPYVLRCTGTLIAEDVVLTAAHCVTHARHFRHVGHVVPKIAFRPGSNVAFGGLGGTMQVRHTELHPAYWRASFANGGSHNTFCPDGDMLTNRQTACNALVTRCEVADLPTLRTITLPENQSDPEQHDERVRVRRCVDGQDEKTLRQAGYLGVQDDHDMALLFLEAPVPNARIAQLPTPADTQALSPGLTLVGVGYGAQGEDAERDPQVSRRGEKRFMHNTLEELGQWELRLGMGPPQACHADSGGPLFFAEPQAQMTILGVVSRLADSRSVQCDRGVIYGRVDRELQWIDSTLEDLCQRGVRYGCRKLPFVGSPTPVAAATPHAGTPPAAAGCQTGSTPAAWALSACVWGLLRLKRRLSKRNLGL